LAPPFPKASAKVQPFSDSARTLPIIFRKNIKIMENQEEMSVFQGNNRQPERTEVRYLGVSKEQRRRAQKAQTLKRSSVNGEAPEFRRIGRGIKQEKQGVALLFSYNI
jgi:hypothetical protein